MTYEEFAALARRLPGIVETTSFGTPAVKVGRKFLARLRSEDKEPGVLVLTKIDEMEKEMLLETRPETFFITDHYRGHPTVLIRLAKADPAQVEDLLVRSWRQLATKTHLRQYEAGTPYERRD